MQSSLLTAFKNVDQIFSAQQPSLARYQVAASKYHMLYHHGLVSQPWDKVAADKRELWADILRPQ